MKKLIMAVIFLFVLSLSSCTDKNLTNDFFENGKSDDIDVLWDVLDIYDDFIEYHYDTFAQNTYGNESIDTLDEYVYVDFRSTIHRDDLINYELTDNRSYLEGSLSYTYLEVSNHKDFVNENCENIKEGIKCDGQNDNEYFTYYLNDEDAYIIYGQVVNEYLMYKHKMYFYTNEDEKKVFDYTLESISTDLMLPSDQIFRSILVENEGETQYTCWNYNDEDGNIGLEFGYRDDVDGSYVSIMVNKYQMYNIHYFDPIKEIYYKASIDQDIVTMNDLEVYDGHIMLAKMNPLRGYFKINMMPIDGWDYITKIDGYDYPVKYEMPIVGLSMDNPMIVHLESRTGEYVYYEYSHFGEVVPEDILDLSRFYLESRYTLAFYLDEVDDFSHTYQSLIEDANMDESFETLTTHFDEILGINR
jgi:hypothetical protein